ncbi:MAG: hypothetical protein Q9226_009050 [Calogaya cf. arnoldii]
MAHALKTLKEIIAVAKTNNRGVESRALIEVEKRVAEYTAMNPSSDIFAPVMSIVQIKEDICKRAGGENILRQFWDTPRIDRLPTPLETDVFEMHFDRFVVQLKDIYALHHRLRDLSNAIPGLEHLLNRLLPPMWTGEGPTGYTPHVFLTSHYTYVHWDPYDFNAMDTQLFTKCRQLRDLSALLGQQTLSHSTLPVELHSRTPAWPKFSEGLADKLMVWGLERVWVHDTYRMCQNMLETLHDL